MKDTSLHRSQILQIYERCRLCQQNSRTTPENSTAFWREEFQTVCFDSFMLKASQELRSCRSSERKYPWREQILASNRPVPGILATHRPGAIMDKSGRQFVVRYQFADDRIKP